MAAIFYQRHFQMIFLTWKVYLKHISPINVPKGSVNNMLALAKIMPWCWAGDGHCSGQLVALVYWRMHASVGLGGLNSHLNMAYVRTIIMTITDTLKRPCYVSGDNRRYVQGSFVYAPIQWKTALQGIILCIRPANEKRRYIVTPSLIGRVHTQNDFCTCHE